MMIRQAAYGHCFSLTLISPASPSLHVRYTLHHYYDRLRHPYHHFRGLVFMHLNLKYFFQEEQHGLPKFRCTSLQTRHRLGPRGLASIGFVSMTNISLLPASLQTASAYPTYLLSGLNTFTLTDYGSSASLSTLRRFRYLERRKTRYMMELTTPFMMGLSPTRGAQLSLAHSII